VVVLDLTMPKMDGVETFAELRAIDRDVKVLLVSGYNEQEAVQQFSGKGLAGFLQKPYSIGGMATALRTIMEPR
jgi:DNA-binding NarL/FixJ family response regulator